MSSSHDGSSPSPDEGAPSKKKLQGLLFFRLLVAVFFLLLTVVVQSRREGELFPSQLQPLYFFSCILFVFTIIAALSLGRVQHLRRFARLQLSFDVAAVTFLIFLSGGVESIFSFLYMPVITSAALLLDRRGSLLAASLCSLSYGLLLDLQYFDWISPQQVFTQPVFQKDSWTYLHSLLMNITAFYLVAYLSGHLAKELEKSSRRVLEQKRDFDHLEMLHHNIVQSMNSGLLTVGSGGLIHFANRAAQEVLQLSIERLEGRHFTDIFPSVDPGNWEKEVPASHSPIPPRNNRKEVQYRSPLGGDYFIGYTVSLLQKAEDAPPEWIFIFQDVTPLKAMEQHVRRLERLAFAGKIAAEIAHEIKNPLASMSGAVEMLQADTGEDSPESRLMNIVYREIQRINELVTDFLWLSKGARKSAMIENVRLCTIIEEVIDLLKARNKLTASHQIRTDFESSPVSMVDRDHFRQILWNLFVNALEAMPQGGNLQIAVSVPNENESCIRISDSGVGIPDDIRERIFEPFFTTKESGTGLGLSIVYQLVENLGGRIEFCRDDGQGTSFSLFFPLAP